MKHQIFTGTFRELERRFVELVGELQASDPLREVNVLVGSNILASYLRRRIAERGRAAANIRLHTFLDLAFRLARAESAGPAPRLPRLAASVVLDGILAAPPPAAYAPVADYAGFRDSLLDTFRDLRDGGFRAEGLARALGREDLSPDRRQHLESLTGLYGTFRERTSLFRDVDEDFRAAVRSASRAPFLGIGRLIVYGIYDATGQQSELLRALSEAVDMVYFVPYTDEYSSTFARPFLKKLAGELSEGETPLGPAPPRSALEALAARGFGSPGAALPADGSITLVSAPGESRAAVEIVREIFRAVRDGTIRALHEAAVVLRQPETDVPILAEALRLRKVPYFVHGGQSFAEQPCGRAALALCRLEADSYAPGAVFSAMELAGRDVGDWRVLAADSQLFSGLAGWDRGTEAIVAEASAELGRAESDSQAADEEAESRRRSIASLRRRLALARSLEGAWQVLRKAAAGWPESLGWRPWARWIEERFEPVLGQLEGWPHFGSVVEEIESLEALGPQAVSAQTLKKALAESISSLYCPVGRFGHNAVHLISSSAARGLRFPLVLVPGLDEGRFPAKLRQDPLLLDPERRLLGSLPLKSKRADEERMLFDMAARSAERRLVLLTSRLDEISDRERIPSQFFLEAASAVAGRVVSVRDLSSVPGYRSVSLERPAPPPGEIAVDEGEIRLRLVASDSKNSHAVLRALAAIDPQRFRRPLEFDRARWCRRLTEFDGRLKDPGLIGSVAGMVGASAGPVSASRMEEYAKCPYFFFLKRVLGLEAWKEPERAEGMAPLDRGLAIHAIVEGFLGEYSGGRLTVTAEEELWRALESRALESLERARPAGLAELLWEVERDALLAMLRAWLQFEKARSGEGLRTVALERAFGKFGPGQENPVLRLKAGRHTFDFRGRIDRVDVSPDGTRARVIDYKTGTAPQEMTRDDRTPLMWGERIQIAVYRSALSVFEDLARLQSVEGEYLHLQPKDSKVVPCSFSGEELDRAAEALREALGIMAELIESGVFFPRTKGRIRPEGHCKYCDYLPICGRDREQREEWKSQDPDVWRFRALEDF